MQNIRVERFEDLSHLPAPIIRFWCEQASSNPMRSPDWILTWCRVYMANTQNCVCMYVVYDDNNPIAIAPFYLRVRFPGVRSLRLIGDKGPCTDHCGIVINSNDRPAVVKQLASAIHRDAGKLWDTLCFESVDLDDIELSALIRELQKLKFEFTSHNATDCWVAELAETQEDFFMSLSKNHRKRCRQWMREFFDSGRARIVEATPDNWTGPWQRLVKLNRSRRSQKGDRSAFDYPNFIDFHQAFLKLAIPSCRATIGELYVDNKHVASEYYLRGTDTIYCYQGGMLTDDTKIGYGNLSTLGLINRSIERGYRRIDFLRGDEPYKMHWNAVRHHSVTWRTSVSSITGNVYRGLREAVDLVRDTKHVIISPRESVLSASAN